LVTQPDTFRLSIYQPSSSNIHQQVKMGQEVYIQNGLAYLRYVERPLEVAAQNPIEEASGRTSLSFAAQSANIALLRLFFGTIGKRKRLHLCQQETSALSLGWY